MIETIPSAWKIGYPDFTNFSCLFSAEWFQYRKRYKIMGAIAAMLGAGLAAGKAALAGSGIAKGIGSMIAGAVNAGSALAGTHMRNEAQKRESELAWERQRQAIAEQNAFNSASAQMARLQAAGLNPNLMYDNGQQASAGMQDNVAEYQPAEMENAFAPAGAVGSQVIQDMIGLKDIQNKTDLTAAEVALKSLQGLNEVTKAGLNKAQTKIILQEWGFKELYNPLEIQHKRVQIGLDANRSAKVVSDIRVNGYLMRKISAETGLTLAETERISGLWLYERDDILSKIRNREYQNLAAAGNAQLAYTNSDYLRGQLKLAFMRYYTDIDMFNKKLDVDKGRLNQFTRVVDLQYKQFGLQKRKADYDFWVGDVGGAMSLFSNDMVKIGTVGLNLLSSPLFENVLSPRSPIGF